MPKASLNIKKSYRSRILVRDPNARNKEAHPHNTSRSPAWSLKGKHVLNRSKMIIQDSRIMRFRGTYVRASLTSRSGRTKAVDYVCDRSTVCVVMKCKPGTCGGRRGGEARR